MNRVRLLCTGSVSNQVVSKSFGTVDLLVVKTEVLVGGTEMVKSYFFSVFLFFDYFVLLVETSKHFFHRATQIFQYRKYRSIRRAYVG